MATEPTEEHGKIKNVKREKNKMRSDTNYSLMSFRRMPDKSAQRVERPQGGPQGERSE